VVAAIVEQLAIAQEFNAKGFKKSAAGLLRIAAGLSIGAHKTGLTTLLTLRVGPQGDAIRNVTGGRVAALDYLERVYVASTLTDGAAQFPQTKNPLVGATGDLTELGIASSSRVERVVGVSDFDTVQAIEERFVLEVLADCFAKVEWSDAATRARLVKTVQLLRTLLEKLGPKIQARATSWSGWCWSASRTRRPRRWRSYPS